MSIDELSSSDNAAIDSSETTTIRKQQHMSKKQSAAMEQQLDISTGEQVTVTKVTTLKSTSDGLPKIEQLQNYKHFHSSRKLQLLQKSNL